MARNMAAVSDVIGFARQLRQTDSNGISDTIGLAFTNDALLDMTRELLNRNLDAAQTREWYADTTTTKPNTYAWPSMMFSLKTVEVDFQGGGGNNYQQAQIMDVANIQNSSFDWLRNNQSTQYPLIDNRGDTFELFPVPNTAITQGIRIFGFLTPTEYSAVGTTIGYPQSLDYRCLSARVASLDAMRHEEWNAAKGFEEEYQSRLQQIIKILAPGTQQPIRAEPLHLTGWNF